MLRRIILLVSILVAILIVAAIAAVVLIDPDDYREEIAQRASAQLGREVQLAGPIELKLFPWLAFEIHSASVGNPPDFDPAPPLAEIGRATASIRIWPLIRGELEIGSIVLEEAALNLISDRRGRSNMAGLFAPREPARQRGPTDLSGLQTGSLRLKDVVLSLLDLASGERTELIIDTLDLAPFAAGRDLPLSLRARLVRDGEPVLHDLRFDGLLQVAPDLSRVMLTNWRASFELPGSGIGGRARGEALVDLSAPETAVMLSALSAELDLPDIPIGFRAVEPVQVTLGDPARAVLSSAELALDDQRLQLSGDLSLADPIRGRLEINGQRLDLRSLAAAGGHEADANSEDEADFSALQGIDLQAGLRLDELIVAEGMHLNQVVAQSRLEGGIMWLEPMQARLFGGQFEGSARVDFNRSPPAVSVSPRLSGVLVEELAGIFTDHAPVAGSGDLTMDLTFQGLGLADILATLDGVGQFAVTDGAVRGVDLNQLIEQELTTASLGQVRKAFDGQTPFRNLTGSMRAEQGVISLPDLNLAAAGFGARGSGQVDFAADRVDYRIELDLGEALVARLPSRLKSATGGRIPLAIAGPISAPIVSVDLAGIAESAVRDELGRRLMDRLGGEEDPSEPTTEPDDEDQDAEKAPERERTSRQLLRGLLEKSETRPEEESEEESTEDEPPAQSSVGRS